MQLSKSIIAEEIKSLYKNDENKIEKTVSTECPDRFVNQVLICTIQQANSIIFEFSVRIIFKKANLQNMDVTIS